ncbi:hypothetical protein A3462_11865 [Enterobacter bugandensis]|nr:hypothetical protein SS14_02015 [Enterobacter bugandensis]KZP60451.1 hypothetical protein A3462_11865 [Enterobacter bugandensis]
MILFPDVSNSAITKRMTERPAGSVFDGILPGYGSKRWGKAISRLAAQNDDPIASIQNERGHFLPHR